MKLTKFDTMHNLSPSATAKNQPRKRRTPKVRESRLDPQEHKRRHDMVTRAAEICGTRVNLATKLQVDPSTISKWCLDREPVPEKYLEVLQDICDISKD